MSQNAIIALASQLISDTITEDKYSAAVANGLDHGAVLDGKLGSLLQADVHVEVKQLNLMYLTQLFGDLVDVQSTLNAHKVKRILLGDANSPALINTKLTKGGDATQGKHIDGLLYSFPAVAIGRDNPSVVMAQGGAHRITSLIVLAMAAAQANDEDWQELAEHTMVDVLCYYYRTTAQAKAAILTDNGSRTPTPAEKAQVSVFAKHGFDVKDSQAVLDAVASKDMGIVDAMPHLVGTVRTGNGDIMTDTSKATVVKAVTKRLINITEQPCKYGINQDGEAIILAEKSTIKQPTWRLAYLGGTIERRIPDTDADAFLVFTPETDSSNDGINLFSDVPEYKQETATLTATVDPDIEGFAYVITGALRHVVGNMSGNVARSTAEITSDVIELLTGNGKPVRVKEVLLPVSNYNPKAGAKRTAKKS